MAKVRGIGAVGGHIRRDGRPKVRYETQDEARAVASSRQKPYLCDLCRGWHVGARR